jgi:hypothetical protein
VTSTIKATLEASADGTLHLPLPAMLRAGKFNVTATVEPVKSENGAIDSSLKGFGCLKGKIHLAEDFDAPLDDFKDYME